jgi:hypothetical protein
MYVAFHICNVCTHHTILEYKLSSLCSFLSFLCYFISRRLGYPSGCMSYPRVNIPTILLLLLSHGWFSGTQLLLGVRVSPLGPSAINWPIVPVLDDRWIWNIWWNEDWQGKQKYMEKTCPSATLFTTDLTWPDLGSNPANCGGKPATNNLSHDMIVPSYT